MTEADVVRSATAVRRGIDNSITPEHRKNLPRLLSLIATIESVVGKMTITSGYRSPALNTAVGGSKTSAHSLCLAVDFEVPGKSNLTVCQALQKVLTDYDQIIYEFGEAGWVHVGLSAEGKAPRKQALSAIKQDGKTVYKSGFVA
jgi:hypothetical protein